MPNITRWDPFAEMATLRSAFDRMFEERPFRAFGNGDGGGAYVPVDVFETDDEVVLKASLPGVRAEDIDIGVHGNVLTLKGESRTESEDSAKNWYHRERRYGTFVRQFTLPSEVDSEKAQANFEDGVLRLTLPKAESEKPKTIKVNAQKPLEAGRGS